MSDRNLLKKILNLVETNNELLEQIKESVSDVESKMGTLDDIKLDLEAIRARLGA